METLLSGLIIQLMLSGLLFVLLIYFVLKNAKLKRQIEQANTSSNHREDE